jgi:hypothetical protein
LDAGVRAEPLVEAADAGSCCGGADAEARGDLVAVQACGEQRDELHEVRGDVGGVGWDGDSECGGEVFGVEA